MKTGLLGGTFDPPHIGHLIVAQDAALALGLDRILFVPAAIPPHKRGSVITPAEQRLAMLELATGVDTRFGIDTVELRRSGPSYTADTLRELSERGDCGELTLLIGADQYAEFDTWREPDEIRRLARVAVLTRGGLTGAQAAPVAPATARPGTLELAGNAIAVNATRIDISSTAIRARVAAGLPIRYMVPAAVEQFIFENGMYVRNGTPAAG